MKNIDEIVENQLIELRKNDKYQQALNDVISNAETDFKTKNDSFYLLQELVNKNLKLGEINRGCKSECEIFEST